MKTTRGPLHVNSTSHSPHRTGELPFLGGTGVHALLAFARLLAPAATELASGLLPLKGRSGRRVRAPDPLVPLPRHAVGLDAQPLPAPAGGGTLGRLPSSGSPADGGAAGVHHPAHLLGARGDRVRLLHHGVRGRAAVAGPCHRGGGRQRRRVHGARRRLRRHLRHRRG